MRKQPTSKWVDIQKTTAIHRFPWIPVNPVIHVNPSFLQFPYTLSSILPQIPGIVAILKLGVLQEAPPTRGEKRTETYNKKPRASLIFR